MKDEMGKSCSFIDNLAVAFCRNAFCVKANLVILVGTNGEIGSEMRVVGELSKKKNGTYFLGKTILTFYVSILRISRKNGRSMFSERNFDAF
jgi:hypothetical protein